MNPAEFQLFISRLVLNMTDVPSEVTGDPFPNVVLQRDKVL